MELKPLNSTPKAEITLESLWLTLANVLEAIAELRALIEDDADFIDDDYYPLEDAEATDEDL